MSKPKTTAVTVHTPIRLKEVTHRKLKRRKSDPKTNAPITDEAGQVIFEEVEKPIADGLHHTFELVNSKGEVVFTSTRRFPTPEAALRSAQRTLKKVAVN